MSFTQRITAAARAFWYSPSERATQERQRSAEARETLYSLNDSLYDNAAYLTHWDRIREICFPKCDPGTRIFGYFSPFKEIVEAYQNVMPGTFGEGVSIANEFEGKPINPKLADPIRKIWRDSNLDTEKSMIIRRAANLGTVGLRIAYFSDSARVVIQHDHPSRLHYVEQDARGNVVAVTLKYKMPRNVGTNLEPKYEDVEVVELLTKDEFSVKHDGEEQLDSDQRKNNHGFCPYVLLRHKDSGVTFGDWSYKGSEHIIHAINFRISQQDRSIARHMFPKWVMASAGDKPQSVAMGSEEAVWLKLQQDGPTPFLQAIVPQLDQEHTREFWMELREMIRGAQPELTINDVKLLGNVSGETIMQVLKPAESAILGVRPNYDHAFIRIIQMGLSIMADNAVADVGTGSGETAGDKAYESGLLNFTFADRPALPQTPAQVTALATASVADRSARFGVAKAAQGLGVSVSEVLRIAGYTEKEIKTILDEKATADVVPAVEQ